MKQPLKQECFHSWRPLMFFPLIFFFSLVLHLARLSVTTVRIRWDLDPTEVEQAVQFLQDGPSITPLPEGLVCLPAQSRAWTRFQETDSYSRRAGQGRRRPWYLLISALLWRRNGMSTVRATKWPPAGQWCKCLCPNNHKRTSWGWSNGPTSFSGPRSLLSTMEPDWYLPQNARIGRSATGALCFSQMKPWAHVTDVKAPGECCCNIILNDKFGGGSREAHRPLQTWQRHPDCHYRLGWNTWIHCQTYTGALGPGFLLVHDINWPVMRVCRQFLHTLTCLT